MDFRPTRPATPDDRYRGCYEATGALAIFEIACDQSGGWGICATAHDGGLWYAAAATLDYAIVLCRQVEAGHGWATWTDASDPSDAPGAPLLPQVGDRVRLRCDVDRYPHFIAPGGTTGTVVYVDADETRVRADRPIDGCEEWSNEIVWYVAEHPGDFVGEVERLDGRPYDLAVGCPECGGDTDSRGQCQQACEGR